MDELRLSAWQEPPPLHHMERVARAAPFSDVWGRVLAALGHFLAAFKVAYLAADSPTRSNAKTLFSRCRHLLEALLFGWHPI